MRRQDKHPADVLADFYTLDQWPSHMTMQEWAKQSAAMLRRIPALEKLAAERLAQMDADRKQALQWRDERDKLRTELANARAEVLAEREACAVLVDKLARRLDGTAKQVARETAELIRARGQEGGAA